MACIMILQILMLASFTVCSLAFNLRLRCMEKRRKSEFELGCSNNNLNCEGSSDGSPNDISSLYAQS